MKYILSIAFILLSACDLVVPCERLNKNNERVYGFQRVRSDCGQKPITHCVPCSEAKEKDELETCRGYTLKIQQDNVQKGPFQ